MFSFWEQNYLLPSFDVLIVGGGIVGLSSAISLKEKEPNLNIAILDKNFIPTGASTRNAGLACFGSISELLDDIDNTDLEKTLQLVTQRYSGLNLLRDRCGDASIDFQMNSGFEIFTDVDDQLFDRCSASISMLNENLKAITKSNDTFKIADDKIDLFGLGKTSHLIENHCEGQLNAGKMVRRLFEIAKALGIEFISGIQVATIDLISKIPCISTIEGFKIKGKKILICTNGFTKSILADLDVIPARNQVWVTNPMDSLKVRGSFHYHFGFYYFRNIGNRILIGGGRHLDKKGEETDQEGESKIIQNGLMQVLKEIVLPKNSFEIEYKWSGIMGLGSEKRPIIKKVKDHIYVAVRMGGMGVAIGSLVGEEAANLVLSDQ